MEVIAVQRPLANTLRLIIPVQSLWVKSLKTQEVTASSMIILGTFSEQKNFSELFRTLLGGGGERVFCLLFFGKFVFNKYKH